MARDRKITKKDMVSAASRRGGRRRWEGLRRTPRRSFHKDIQLRKGRSYIWGLSADVQDRFRAKKAEQKHRKQAWLYD